MKNYNLLFLLCILLLGCKSEAQRLQPRQPSYGEYQEPYSSDLLSFEMCFGSELSGTTKEEFLLVSPRHIRVKDDGDIIVADEFRLKVYDKYGKEKKIIGGPGEGPGAFEKSIPSLYIGPSEHLIAESEFGSMGTYNLFGQDYKLIEKKRMFSIISQFKEYLKTKGITPENMNKFSAYVITSKTSLTLFIA